MNYASVVLDIPTRALEGAFTYAIPEALATEAVVGATVLVSFSHRPAIGYVVDVGEKPPAEAMRIKPIEQVVGEPSFDAVGARLAMWMSDEYACSLADAIHPLLAPGKRPKVRKGPDGAWEVVRQATAIRDDRWVELTEEGASFEPVRTASRQRQLLWALRAGPVRLAELSATIGGASAVVRTLEGRGVVRTTHRRVVRGESHTSLSSAAAPTPERLTQGQRRALDTIRDACRAARGDVVVVDGVTGSGKTEVYLQSIEEALARGRGAIVLVPEISLTAQTVGRFRARFGAQVAVLHSRLSDGERLDQWDLVRQGVARVVVGARSALFAPLRDPGVIVIDEEHEGSYKQDGPPRYHAREVAAHLARLRGCALVLGSATPSIESVGRCEAGTWGGARWTRVEMPERPGDARLPEVQVVDMASEFRRGGRSVFSAPLANALREVVARKQKAVLLHNRRGFANFVMCRECGCVPECPHCSTSLTYHERTHSLACHTCGRSWAIRAYPDPSTCCPNCGSRYMGAYGVGTQRVEDELAMLLAQEGVRVSVAGMGAAVTSSAQGEPANDASAAPCVEVIRMDADTTRGKEAHQRLLERFDAAECAILVGTQMIAKGLDFPEVTLVGVINADTTLKLPDFRAAERTYDLLEQVAGRAGRGELDGKVIVQTYWASHPAIQAVDVHDRAIFLQSELEQRREAGYPPFTRIANVVITGADEGRVREAAQRVGTALRSRVGNLAGWDVLGPADCVRRRVKDRFRQHVAVKSPPNAEVGKLLLDCVRDAKATRGVSVSIDVDAGDMM